MTNTDTLVWIYDIDGEPLSGLAPMAQWQHLKNLDTGTAIASSPSVTEDPPNSGQYRLQRLTGGHIVGRLNFGDGAHPKYVGYDCPVVTPLWAFKASGETVNPTIVSISVTRRTQLQVTFSKPVVMTDEENGALYPGNWHIDDLTILGITSVDNRTVLLTTTTQVAERQYTLGVLNIEDLDGNPVVAP